MQKIRLMSYLTLVLFCLACKSTQPSTLQESDFGQIRSVLGAQQAAWNKGSLEEFMKGYINSSELAFIGSNGVTKGWDETLANYKKGYKDKAAMGKLEFEVLEMRDLGPASCLMIGKYTLTRENDEPSGYFSLIWEKLNGQWLITTDHTSG